MYEPQGPLKVRMEIETIWDKVHFKKEKKE
jgi:hypothetical protein